MTDKPISPEVLREAERLLPCTNEWGRCTAAVDRRTGKAMHSPLCETRYRPAVARALQDREDRIAEAEGHIRALLKDLQLRSDKTQCPVCWAFKPVPHDDDCEFAAAQAWLDSLGKPDNGEVG